MTNYWEKSFLNKLNFKKCRLKSPRGNGLFRLFINEENFIIYKKIIKNIDTNNILRYRNILFNLKNNQILNKYIFHPEKITIENDGSYYSKFIKNGIRLYDINSNSILDYKILNKIENKLIDLQNDLNKYVKTNKLSGDWALHNLIYCLDTNKIYNVDLEGFYTYPLIHDNGNCDINCCNERFDKLLKDINIQEKVNDDYFTLILWNPTLFQSEKILRDIPNIIDKREIIIPNEHLHEYIFDIYKLDTRCSHNIVLPPKIQKLKEYDDKHIMVKFKINNPKYTNNICEQAVKLKEIIRNKYKSNIKNYIKDIIIHIADNFEQSKYIWEKNIDNLNILKLLVQEAKNPLRYKLSKIENSGKDGWNTINTMNVYESFVDDTIQFFVYRISNPRRYCLSKEKITDNNWEYCYDFYCKESEVDKRMTMYTTINKDEEKKKIEQKELLNNICDIKNINSLIIDREIYVTVKQQDIFNYIKLMNLFYFKINKLSDLDDIKLINWKEKHLTIFSRTNYLFLEKLFKILSEYHSDKNVLLYTGGSDNIINKKIYNKKPKCITKWFTHHTDLEYKDIIIVPLGALYCSWIGIENLKIIDKFYRGTKPFLLKRKDNKNNKRFLCLMTHVSDTNKTRTELTYFKDKKWIFHSPKLHRKDYLVLLSKFHFVFCPIGNGIGTQRMWECYYLGCIPIVKNNVMHRYFSNYLPIVIYDNISEITENLLIKKLTEFSLKDYNYDLIKFSYWENYINNTICMKNIKKDKIAICFSGQLRTYIKTYKSFYKNIVDVLIQKFEVDIFMFIWKTENKDDIEKALEIYKPKKYIIKDDFEFKLPYFCENMYFYKGRFDNITNNFGNNIKQYYGVAECFNLIENNYYDYVIRNRYDNLFEEKIDITTFNNNIYIPTGHYFHLNGNPTNMNDSFAYGPYNLMKKYSNFINTYKDILLQIKNRELTDHYSYLYKAITPTLLFKYYISSVEKILYSETEINYGLLRNNNSLTKFVNNQNYAYDGTLYKINDLYYEFVTFILWKSNKDLQKNIINNFKEYEVTIDTFNYNKEKRYNLMSQIYYPHKINNTDPRLHYNDTVTLLTIKYYRPDYKYIYRSKKYHPCINSIINYKMTLRRKFTALDFHVSDFLNESNDCLLSLKNISPEFIIIDYNNLYGICHNGKTTHESRTGNFSFINVKNSYNYRYLLGDKEEYYNYCKKRLGHSIEKYDNLIKNFNVGTYNNFNQITVYQYGNDYIISDGFHRASLLYSLGYRHITAKIIKKPYDWYVFKFKININILSKENSHNEIYYNLVNNLSKDSIEFEIEHNFYHDKTFYVKNSDYKKYLNDFLIKDETYITNSKKFADEKPFNIKFIIR